MWPFVVIVSEYRASKEQEKNLLVCVPTCRQCYTTTKKSSINNQTCSKVFRVKLQLLFDPVLHQKTEVGVCHWETVTHIYLFFGLLCCKTHRNTQLLHF